MQLEIKNLGLISQGKVSLNGLTVIAGENDTGKSTIGKILYTIIKAENIVRKKAQRKINESNEKTLKQMLGLVFDNTIFRNCEVRLTLEDQLVYEIISNSYGTLQFIINKNSPFLDATYIESPMVWNMTDFFSAVEKMKTEDAMFGIDFDVRYPYILWDLYKKLTLEKHFAIPFEEDTLKQILIEIQEIISGRFIKEGGRFFFNRGRKNISLFNTASGIKTFGLIQVLLDNTYINTKNVLIYDEPEVHLHPKWELLFAKILSIFVRNGVRIIVNTHSIYMVQALKVYTQDFSDKCSFYLIEKDGNKGSIITDVTKDPYPIFKKFNDPIQEIVWGLNND